MVGSGNISLESDVSQLADDTEAASIQDDYSNYHPLYVRISHDGPLLTLYRVRVTPPLTSSYYE